MTGGVWALRTADRADIAEISTVIATSFLELAIARYLVPDDIAERFRCLTGQFAMLVDQAFSDGRVDVATIGGRIVAAAVWRFQDGMAALPAPPRYDEKLRAICGADTLVRFRHLDGLFAEHTPPFAHHHLLLCGTALEHRKHGIGTALLARHHHHLDARPPGAQRVAYLEASNDESAKLYARLGYVPKERVYIVGSDAYFVPMFRAPQPPADEQPAMGQAPPNAAQ